MSTAAARVKALVAAHVAPLLKAARFQKRALVFERTRGAVVQLVTVQLSHGGQGTFYVNVGLIFDAVTALGADTSGSVVIGGKATHYSARIEKLVPTLPAAWTVTDDTTVAAAAAALGPALTTVVAMLDAIVDPATALVQLDLEPGFWKVLRAQLAYITGDRDAARRDLAAVAHEFSARRGCTFAELARDAHLPLEP